MKIRRILFKPSTSKMNVPSISLEFQVIGRLMDLIPAPIFKESRKKIIRRSLYNSSLWSTLIVCIAHRWMATWPAFGTYAEYRASSLVQSGLNSKGNWSRTSRRTPQSGATVFIACCSIGGWVIPMDINRRSPSYSLVSTMVYVSLENRWPNVVYRGLWHNITGKLLEIGSREDINERSTTRHSYRPWLCA